MLAAALLERVVKDTRGERRQPFDFAPAVSDGRGGARARERERESGCQQLAVNF